MADQDHRKNQKKNVDTKVDKKAGKAKKVTGPPAKGDKKAGKAKKVTGPPAKGDKKANKAKTVAGPAAKGGKKAAGSAADSAAIALDAIEIVGSAYEDDNDETTGDAEDGTDIRGIISCLTSCIRGSMAAAKAAEAIGDAGAAVCQKCGTKLKIGKNKGGKSRLCPKCAKR